jgi:transposase
MVANTSVAAAIYVALELSRSGWLVAILLPGEKRPSRYKLEPGERDRLLELIERAKRSIVQRSGRTAPVFCCYEAGYEGFWLHRVLEAAGVCSLVVDPSSLQVNRRARRAKSDGIDVETILRALIAWQGGEKSRASMVVPPSPAVEDDRRVSRERGALVSERTRHLNRIRGLLMAQGIVGFDPRAPDAATQLEHLVTGDGRPMPVNLVAQIRREMTRFDLAARQIGEVERQRDARRPRGRPRKEAPPPPDPASLRGHILALQKLRGIGQEIASVAVREVFWREFANRRQLGAYLGLDPSPFDSGPMHREQGISKAGNRRARHVMIEAAWLWLKWQPASALSQWWRRRTADAGPRVRRVNIVALARKLAIALWRYLKTGLTPAGALLAA